MARDKNSSFDRQSLSSRLAKRTSFVVATMLSILLCFYAVRDFRNLESELLSRTKLILDLTAESLAQPLWDIDKAQVIQRLEWFKSDPDYLGARVYNDQGIELYSYGKVDSADNVILKRSIEYKYGQELKEVGQLEMIFSTNRLFVLVLRQAISLVAGYFILIIVTFFAISRGMQNMLAPLNLLANNMRLYARGDRNINIPNFSTNDEISEVSKAFHQLKSELDLLTKNLEEKVHKRTIELELAKDQAEKALEVKSQFLANMSHEIRTPMNGILGIAELLADTTLTLEQKNDLKMIRDSGKTLLAIINDILDLSKLEAGKIVFEQRSFSLRETVKRIEKLFENRTESSNIEIAFDISVSVPPLIITDEVRLSQIITNLLSNAIKFTEKGGIVIQFESEPIADNNFKLLCRVFDSGIGIPTEKIDKIFETFTQADTSTTRKFGGTGLGLSISRNLARAMGGDLNARSIPGAGSVFEFWLPVGTEVLTEYKVGLEQKKSGDLDDLNLRVLLAEDNLINQKVALRLLEKSGCNVTLAENGEIAVKNYSQNKIQYDLILMDCQMPVLSGYDATKKIREIEKASQGGNKIPIIAMTANALIGDRELCLESGMDDFLAKPFNPEQLYEILRKWKANAGKNSQLIGTS